MNTSILVGTFSALGSVLSGENRDFTELLWSSGVLCAEQQHALLTGTPKNRTPDHKVGQALNFLHWEVVGTAGLFWRQEHACLGYGLPRLIYSIA